MTTVFFALGSNIDPEKNLEQAATLLRERWPSIRFSPVYLTKAMGYENQNDFLNAVAMIESEDSAEEIHDVLKSIEATLKKSSLFRNGPRTIDLDLLLYGSAVIRTDELSVPHPRMQHRKFVLQPLVDLGMANGRHPVSGETWADLLQKTDEQLCRKIELSLS